MPKPLMLITGATGKTGTPTVLKLLGDGYSVRALAHRTDRRSEELRRLGAEVVIGSLEDITDLRAALTGVQRAYYCPPLTPGTLRRATLFATAAKECRVEVIVAMSQWLSDPSHPAIHSREKWLSEKALAALFGPEVITINPGFFADNYMAALEPIMHFGLLAMPLGQGLNAPPCNEDISRVIAGLLVNPDLYLGKTFRPTGPELLSPDQIAAKFALAIDRKVTYKDITLALFMKVARSLSIDEFVLEELYWFLKDYQRNSFGIGAPTDVVSVIGGVEPEPFEKTVKRYVAASGYQWPSRRSMAKAIHNMVRGMLTPSPNPTAIAQRLHLPRLTHPSLAADSSQWLASRSRR